MENEDQELFRNINCLRELWADPRLAPGMTRNDFSRAELRIQLGKLERRGIFVLPNSSAFYPSGLKEAGLNLPGVFVRARSKQALEQFLAKPALALVGSRRGDIEGCALAREFGCQLARAGCNVVSGLALGIDAAAHEGALLSGQSCATIAVLAHGLDEVYPKTNIGIAERILSNGGLLMSPFVPGVRPRAHRFLERNTLIAALSRGLVVIQAESRSGALNSARNAADFGREVMAVPGPVLNALYDGCHKLIRQGATLVRNTEDILEGIGLERDLLRTGQTKVRGSQEEALLERIKETPTHRAQIPMLFDANERELLLELEFERKLVFDAGGFLKVV